MLLFPGGSIDFDDTSIHLNDPSIELTSVELSSKRLTHHSGTICDSFDIQNRAFEYNDSESSLCEKSLLSESVPNEIEASTSTLYMGSNKDELKAQLLHRCGQKDILSFHEIYSAR